MSKKLKVKLTQITNKLDVYRLSIETVWIRLFRYVFITRTFKLVVHETKSELTLMFNAFKCVSLLGKRAMTYFFDHFSYKLCGNQFVDVLVLATKILNEMREITHTQTQEI